MSRSEDGWIFKLTLEYCSSAQGDNRPKMNESLSSFSLSPLSYIDMGSGSGRHIHVDGLFLTSNIQA